MQTVTGSRGQSGRTLRRLVLTCGALCATGAAVASAAQADTVTFATPGEQPPFTVPDRVTSLHVVAIGGRGGLGDFATGAGGFGARATADLAVTPGQVLYIEVAGNGGDAPPGTGGTAGVNGGGTGHGGGGGGGAGGGGASDVRGLPASAGSSLMSRFIIAAGGGGGAAGASRTGGPAGGDGAGAGGGKAGTSTAGGAAGGGTATAGTLGSGGNGGIASDTSGGGGGGGGLYGGGGGNGGPMNNPGFGGGGGSTGFATGTSGASVAPDTTGAPSVTLTYVPAPPPPPPPPDTVAPTLGVLVLAPSAFVAANTGPSAVAAASVGTYLFYKLSEPAQMTFTVERAAIGIRRGRACVARPRRPPRGARRCTRYVAVTGRFTHDGVAGFNALRFMGRLAGRSLPRATYRLVASARDAAGNGSSTLRRPFRIIRR
ncbi:MAG: hypothetical protein QOE65_2887 [Solirubrobacteraceae bacterium]|nr:hypothetical protein [Solirubrobacteraceae bacterium]